MAPSRSRIVPAALTTIVLILAGITATATAGAAAHTTDHPTEVSLSELQQQIVAKQHELEIVTEEYLQAQETLAVEQRNAQSATADQQEAAAAVAATRREVGTLSATAYKSQQPAGVAVFMTAASPREAMDKLATLDRISAYQAARLAAHQQATAHAAQQQKAADAAGAAAQKTADGIAAKKAQLESDVPKLEAKLASLTAQQRAAVLTVSGGESEPVAQASAPPAPAPAPASAPVAGPPPTAGAGGTAAAQAAVQAALSKVGSPYSWGATGPDTFDCSGLLLWSYGQAGVGLPRTSSSQKDVGPKIGLDALMPGDLLWEPGHIAMYIGNGQIIHAPTTGDVVKVVSVGTFAWVSANRPTA